MEIIKNKKYFIALFVLTVFISSCSIDRDSLNKTTHSPLSFGNNSREIKVFFTKSKAKEGLLLVPVTRAVSKDDSIVSAALKELFLGPEKTEELKGLMTEVPIGTRLIKVEEGEDEVLVDISSQYLSGGGSATMQLRYLQIYKTLQSICPDKKIFLNVEGKTLKAIGGEGLEVTQPLTKIIDYTKKPKEFKDIKP